MCTHIILEIQGWTIDLNFLFNEIAYKFLRDYLRILSKYLNKFLRQMKILNQAIGTYINSIIVIDFIF